jgi:hypothetical protein
MLSFFKKYVNYSKSIIMPGLISTNVDGFSSENMCPQGITFAGDYLLETAYDENDEENSVIYVINKNTKQLITTLILPSMTHAGGIAFDGTNLWVPTGTRVSSIPFDQVEEAVTSGEPYYFITYNTTCTLTDTASFLSYHKDKLWIGTYNELQATDMYSYTIEDKDTAPVLVQADTIVIPDRVQGIAFTGTDSIIMSRSCQVNPAYRGYMRQLDLYRPDYTNSVNGVISLGNAVNSVAMPSMNEGIAIDGGYLYVTFESPAFEQSIYKMDRICAFKVASMAKKQ